MNQILSVESPKKEKKKKTRTSGPIEIDKILRFFSIAILIFGVFMIGTGSYAMYQNSKNATASNKPTIEIEEKATEITLQVTHDKNLSKVTYQWNNEEEIEIDCTGKKKVEEKIEIPIGDNTLNVYATDINGQESNFQKIYTIQRDINIEIKETEDRKNYKVIAEGKEQLAYMTYRWDDGEETKIDLNSMQTEQLIKPEKGVHTLTVIVVDINNKTETKVQEVKGVTSPKVEVTTDGSDNFIIKASDEEGIKKVEFIINETEKNVLNLDQVFSIEERKEFEYAYPLHDGENKLEIRVYNESDVCEISKVLVNK
ncbi:MAG: hypothetical protein ACI4VH_05770 [Clostridia bacterium]